MPCYSYLGNNIINFVGNVEVTHIFNGPGNYSFNTLQWICEFPLTDQLRVYGQTGLGGSSETELIQGTDFTINEVNQTINVITNPTIVSLIIRRSTPSNRMIYKFIDGAKLTAKELNASFHQLLFLNQEKDFVNGTNQYNYYPLFSSVSTWTSGNNYVPGNFVTYDGVIYLCKVATNSALPTNTSFWTNVNTSSSHLIITSGPNPLSINLTNLSIGKALVWNGTEFTAQSFSASLNTLTDVNVSGAVSGDIIRYNGINWVKVTPSILDLTANNLLFKDRTFYNLNTNLSYTNNSTGFDVSSKAFLNVFKDNNSKWVLTDPPTVYHIVRKLIPSPNLSGSLDPETYFNYINSALQGLGANLSNPVKLKFFWDLGAARTNVADIHSADAGTNSYHTYYWDRPLELHSILGYTPVVGLNATGLNYHGVETATELHRVSPYFYEVRNKTTGSLVSFTSKVQGYGIKSFYLSVPECYSSPLANIPARSGGTWVLLGTFANLTDQLAYIGGESPIGYTYRDYYLMGLRDMAFAAARPDATQTAFASGNVKQITHKTRLLKGTVINVQYSGLDNVDFNRLEENVSQSVLWKIPRQIIYYNKVATGFAIQNPDAYNTSTTASLDLASVRFQGYQTFQATPIGTAFTNTHLVAAEGRGTLFKAESYWQAWNQAWTTDPTGTNSIQYQSFNQADIDWYMYNMKDGTAPNLYPDNIGLYKINARNPPFTIQFNTFTSGGETAVLGEYLFPWPYRPNVPRKMENNVNAVGNLLFNIDANKLFSEASNFIPDPVDEYVFRIVAKKDLTSFFSDEGYSKLKTAIILEHGFSDSSNFASRTALTNLDTIFNRGNQPSNKYRADSRIDKSKIQVYVKNEALETIGADTRYVITLAIRVPRLKSIGYAKIFRRLFTDSTVNTFPQRDTATSDTEIDAGPWNWVKDWSYFRNVVAPSNQSWQTGQFGSTQRYYIQNNTYAPLIANATESSIIVTQPTIPGYMDQEFVSGRNECAVKFTRVGIPGDMWIRLSVLNTDGTLNLLDSNGFSEVATNEA